MRASRSFVPSFAGLVLALSWLVEAGGWIQEEEGGKSSRLRCVRLCRTFAHANVEVAHFVVESEENMRSAVFRLMYKYSVFAEEATIDF